MSKLIVNKGDAFGKLTVIKEVTATFNSQGNRIRHVLCKCSCGSTYKVVALSELRRTRKPVRSCGCLHIESVSTHKLTKHPLYKTYMDMHKRCYNPNSRDYKDYGARGIKVCKQWRKVQGSEQGLLTFVSDMGARPMGKTLDRINNNEDYSKRNCKWSTGLEQSLNRRSTFLVWCEGRFISFKRLWILKGKLQSYKTAYRRVKTLNWLPLHAVSKPARYVNE